MIILENINTIVSIGAGILSIIMFFLAKKQKDKCIEIKNAIEQNIKVSNNKSIKSTDQFNIKKVDKFDNRKSIK